MDNQNHFNQEEGKEQHRKKFWKSLLGAFILSIVSPIAAILPMFVLMTINAFQYPPGTALGFSEIQQTIYNFEWGFKAALTMIIMQSVFLLARFYVTIPGLLCLNFIQFKLFDRIFPRRKIIKWIIMILLGEVIFVLFFFLIHALAGSPRVF